MMILYNSMLIVHSFFAARKIATLVYASFSVLLFIM